MIRSWLKRLAKTNPWLSAAAVIARRICYDGPYVRQIAEDLARTWREAAFLRCPSQGKSNGELMVFAVDDDSIYSLKLMAYVSQALRLRRWRVWVVLRSRASLLGQAYFRAFGIQDFIFLDDIKESESERELCRATAAKLLNQPLSLRQIKGWHFEGSWIGPQIIATLSRLRFEGMLDFSSAQVVACLSDTLISCLCQVLRAKKLMQGHPTDLALAIEANYSVYGPLVDMAILHGAPVIQMIQPWKDDALIFRRLTHHTRREHPATVSLETLTLLTSRPWTSDEEQALHRLFQDRYGGRWVLQARNQCNTKPYDRAALDERYGLAPDKPLAVVFSHVLWDANLFYGEDIFEDYGEWFVETVRSACANPALNWLVKIHPANVWKRSYEANVGEYAEMALIRKHLGQLPDHVQLVAADDDVSTLSLFNVADYAVTVRGTSGMEMACFGKPCVTAGTGRYSGLGFTLDCVDREHYQRRLATLHEQPSLTTDQVLRAKWHAYAAFRLRPWSMQSAKSVFAYQGKRHPLDHNLVLTVDSLAALEAVGDLALWAEWARGTDVDYMSPPAVGHPT